MQHLMIAGKSVLIGEEVARLLLRYLELAMGAQVVEQTELRALNTDGTEVTLTLLADAGVAVTVESTQSRLPEPQNAEAEQRLREAIGRLESSADAREDGGAPSDVSGASTLNDPSRWL